MFIDIFIKIIAFLSAITVFIVILSLLIPISKNEFKETKFNFKEGNINSKSAELGGKLMGNVSSDQIKILKTAEIEGELNQKILSIEEGAILKIKTETYK